MKRSFPHGSSSALSLGEVRTLLEELPLRRVSPGEKVGLSVVSLPWPELEPMPLTIAGQEAYRAPLGRWPGSAAPRRLWMAVDSDGMAPCEHTLSWRSGEAGAGGSGEEVRAELIRFRENAPGEMPSEQHYLRLSQGGRAIGLAMGLRVGERLQWWEACRLVVQRQDRGCLEIEVGGAIAHAVESPERYHGGFSFDLLHRHNWVNGRIFARLFSNGVCEIYAHHINSRFFDDGLPLKGAVPVIGFYTAGEGSDDECYGGVWDGSTGEVEWGGVSLDLREVARLATPEKPGRIWREEDFTVLQPYLGCELFGGAPAKERIGDAYIFRGESEVIPRGMARTLRFSLSLSDRSPRIARYLPPAWWYGLCGELTAAPLLPTTLRDDAVVQQALGDAREAMWRGGFEDGALVRTISMLTDGRHDPSWEGELPYALLLTAWRGGDGGLYEDGLRAAYYFTDVAIDHAAKMVRMHGWEPNAFSLPMNRAHACVAAWLETGDPYLLEAAEAVIATAHFTQRNSWPRQTVGRDACYLRGAMLLHRYTGSDTFLDFAREGIAHVIASQRANGSFGDQGGGAGIHQWAGYITKPWMCLLAVGGIVDYLELYPGEPAMEQCLLRLADWLMQERRTHDGMTGWSYQHDYRETRVFENPLTRTASPLPTPDHWHQETLARVLGYATFLTGDPAYLEAWAESRAYTRELTNDHAISAALQFTSWIDSYLAHVRWERGHAKASPQAATSLLPESLKVHTPEGLIPLSHLYSYPL